MLPPGVELLADRERHPAESEPKSQLCYVGMALLGAVGLIVV